MASTTTTGNGAGYSGEGVDLRIYVAFALDAWERGHLPCDCCRFVTLDREAPGDRRHCDVCHWVHDSVQSGDWSYRGGANEISLAEAWMNSSQFGACEARFHSRVRSPRPQEFPPWRASAHWDVDIRGAGMDTLAFATSGNRADPVLEVGLYRVPAQPRLV